ERGQDFLARGIVLQNFARDAFNTRAKWEIILQGMSADRSHLFCSLWVVISYRSGGGKSCIEWTIHSNAGGFSMCDERTAKENQEFLRRQALSRRTFNALTGAAGITAMLPLPAFARATSESDVTVKTPDGSADCYFVHPASGKFPGVIVWPD